jgi:transcriptional regulator with XRE-family HTH domain
MAKTLGTQKHKALIAMLIAKREAAGLTQTELASALGEYQSFVARLESGERRVDVIELIQLARLLSFDASALVRELEQVRDNPME